MSRNFTDMNRINFLIIFYVSVTMVGCVQDHASASKAQVRSSSPQYKNIDAKVLVAGAYWRETRVIARWGDFEYEPYAGLTIRLTRSVTGKREELILTDQAILNIRQDIYGKHYQSTKLTNKRKVQAKSGSVTLYREKADQGGSSDLVLYQTDKGDICEIAFFSEEKCNVGALLDQMYESHLIEKAKPE